jgi:hypothetical protein
MDPQDFRKKSQAASRSYSVKNDPPTPNHQSAHKVPNAFAANAYNNTSYENVRKDIMGWAHSDGNIIYSQNNSGHTQQERDLANTNYHQASVNQKGASIAKGLENLHDVQDSAASTHIMRTLRDQGPGYTEVVAHLDKRTFNNPSEKQQIDIARRDAKNYKR